MTTNKNKSSETAEMGDQSTILYKVLDSIPDIIFFKNLDGAYLGCNAAFARFAGKNRAEIIGRTDYDLFDRKLADYLRTNNPLMMEQDEPRHDEEWIDYPDGRHILVDTRKSPLLDSEGRMIGFLGISRDITDRKNAEDELQRINTFLEETTAKANDLAHRFESADIAKSQFLANMSHEIRTPLNGVIGMTRLLLKTTLTDKQRHYAEVAKSSGESLLCVINDILDFSKIEAGKLGIERIRFSIDAVIGSTLDSFWDRAAEKNIEIHAAIDPTIPTWLMGDPLRLAQILNNLMSNAIKFTDGGDIRLSVNIRYRDFQTVVINIAVQDTGIGVTAEQQLKLFTAFGQADMSTTRKFGGTGLGLTICKQLCELMGGRIRMESNAGKGSVFSFILPFAFAEDTNVPLLPELDGKDKKVLVADDNPATRHLLSKLLSARTFQVRCAASGQDVLEALHEADASHSPFDLCLLDLRMPHMNGIETVLHINREKFPSVPPILLMVNSRDRFEMREHAESAGILGFITKPIRPSTLLDEIQSALDINTSDLVKKSDFMEIRYSGIRALTVEDHEINREIAIELLKSIGIETDIARNGLEAVEKVRSQDYDVVFMDIQMPVMDGLEATHAIRSLDKAGVDKLPILAMTALAMKDDREKIMNAGMNGHITKPIDIDELISVLGQWLPPEMRRVEANNYSSSLKTSCSLSLKTSCSLSLKTSCSPSLKTSGDIDPYHQVSFLQIPGLDVTAGLHRLNGNQELYLSLLNKFAENDDYVITREQVLSDPELAHRKAHSIRSIAGNLGGTELASVAAGLEKTLRDGKGYEDYLQQFIELNNALRAAIAAIVPQRKDSTYTESLKPMGTVDNLRQLLSQLRNPVTNNEPMACKEILKLLQANRWPDETVADIAELNQLISKYRFNEATKTLDRLMESIDKI